MDNDQKSSHKIESDETPETDDFITSDSGSSTKQRDKYVSEKSTETKSHKIESVEEDKSEDSIDTAESGDNAKADNCLAETAFDGQVKIEGDPDIGRSTPSPEGQEASRQRSEWKEKVEDDLPMYLSSSNSVQEGVQLKTAYKTQNYSVGGYSNSSFTEYRNVPNKHNREGGEKLPQFNNNNFQYQQFCAAPEPFHQSTDKQRTDANICKEVTFKNDKTLEMHRHNFHISPEIQKLKLKETLQSVHSTAPSGLTSALIWQEKIKSESTMETGTSNSEDQNIKSSHSDCSILSLLRSAFEAELNSSVAAHSNTSFTQHRNEPYKGDTYEYICEVCQECFSSPFQLTVHEVNSHSIPVGQRAELKETPQSPHSTVPSSPTSVFNSQAKIKSESSIKTRTSNSEDQNIKRSHLYYGGQRSESKSTYETQNYSVGGYSNSNFTQYRNVPNEHNREGGEKFPQFNTNNFQYQQFFTAPEPFDQSTDKQRTDTNNSFDYGQCGFTCYICKVTFKNGETAQKHWLECKKTHKCMGCGRSFTRKWVLTNHICQNRKEAFICRLCRQGFSRKDAFDFHMSNHLANGSVKCEKCCRWFCNALNLQHHLKDNISCVKYKCVDCQEYFPFADKLAKHRLNFHISLEEKKKFKETLQSVHSTAPSGPTSALNSQKKIKSESSMKTGTSNSEDQNIKSSHLYYGRQRGELQATYKTRNYSVAAHSHTSFTEHRNEPNKNDTYICEICQERFPGQLELLKHKLNSHIIPERQKVKLKETLQFAHSTAPSSLASALNSQAKIKSESSIKTRTSNFEVQNIKGSDLYYGGQRSKSKSTYKTQNYSVGGYSNSNFTQYRNVPNEHNREGGEKLPQFNTNNFQYQQFLTVPEPFHQSTDQKLSDKEENNGKFNKYGGSLNKDGYQRKCVYCSQRFATSYELDNHWKSCREKKRYRCYICAAPFLSNELLMEHSRIHHNN